MLKTKKTPKNNCRHDWYKQIVNTLSREVEYDTDYQACVEPKKVIHEQTLISYCHKCELVTYQPIL